MARVKASNSKLSYFAPSDSSLSYFAPSDSELSYSGHRVYRAEEN